MWGEPLPTWRTARKQHQCQGADCTKIIVIGERYLDRPVRRPIHGHLRYCEECAGPVLSRAAGYHFFNGRNDIPDRYHEHISSAQWKALKRNLIEQNDSRCHRCGVVSTSLDLHHLHYRSLGREQPEDVELLCLDCHKRADENRARKRRPKFEELEEVWIVGPDGDRRGKLDPNSIYVPHKDGRYVPVTIKPKSR